MVIWEHILGMNVLSAFLGRLEVVAAKYSPVASYVVITSTISIFFWPSSKLFDPGSTDIYVSTYFSTHIDLSFQPLPMLVGLFTHVGGSLVVD